MAISEALGGNNGYPSKGIDDALYTELWHHCAGPLVTILRQGGLNLHISEIEELCSEFPSTVVLLDHVAFCKPPINDEERVTFTRLLEMSKFPQGERVFYFPQGHIEQVEASTNQVADKQIPNYNLPSKILYRVMNVELQSMMLRIQ